MIFWNKGFEVIFFVDDVTNKTFHVIQIILQMCSCDQSLVIVTFLGEKLLQPQFYKDLTRKTAFFWWVILVQVHEFGTGTRCKLKILHQCGKKFKTKSQKVLGTNSYVCRSYRGKTGKGTFLPPPLPSWIGAFGQKKWVFDNHMKILNLNFKEKKYSQGYNLKGCSLLFYPKLCVGMSLGFRKKNTN